MYQGEIKQLKEELAKCANGEQFLLQCGDCSESFADCSAEVLGKKVKTMYGFRELLEEVTGKPVVLIGRIAGQFAKPRSEPYETVLTATGQPLKVLSYRGDNVNCIDIEKRDPNPKRMLDGYYRAATIMCDARRNYIRMYSSQTCIQPMYISHEGLLLCYEAAMTRGMESTYFDASTHFLWVGERTRKLGSAHVEFFHGIENPVGIKIGPNANLEELVIIMQQLNPKNEVGKLVLIPRLGIKFVRAQFPRVVQAVRASGIPHVWEVDPMHGNTFKTEDGIKTRRLEDVIGEVVAAIEVLREQGEELAGMHIESSYEDVTECIGGRCGVKESDLCQKYTTLCDPRLNVSQMEELLQAAGRRLRD